jgi:hypothetical protein
MLLIILKFAITEVIQKDGPQALKFTVSIIFPIRNVLQICESNILIH